MTKRTNRVESTLLRRINERRLLEVIQQQGPSSRAMLARTSGLTAPTVSKAVDLLLSRGLLEELDPVEPALGRPGRLVRMAAESAAVLGVVVDASTCCIVAAGLDGKVTEEQTRRLPTPETYAAVIDGIEHECRELLAGIRGTVHGIGVSVPGLVNERLREIVFSPNLRILDKRNPARDLEDRLGVPCLLAQETDALCLSERMYGDARGLEDFAVLDATTGLGLGVMSGGQLLAGHSGMAGEVGHITVAPDGLRCGCGNRGCLETLATDAALLRLLAERLGHPLDMAKAATLLDDRAADFQHEIRTVTEHLAIAIAAVINIFNPTSLFVHGTLLAGSEERFARVLERVKQRTLTASLSDCTIVAARSSKRQGAIASIMHHVTNTWAPSIR
ncbi:MAG: ROK family transcriptional regulator [Planctomycetia bacterium]|nr:ROK family transcriptional regulator [Planctomycetia bacterium]